MTAPKRIITAAVAAAALGLTTQTNAAPAVPAAFARPAGSPQADAAFIASVVPGAQAAQCKYGVPAAVTTAQAIDESGWGASTLAADQHNLFGIKGTGPAGSISLPTSEFYNGQWVQINADFRVYHNIAESIADHAALLANSGYYTKAMSDTGNPDTFANDLTGVYATDPNYGATLITFMDQYGLRQYDAVNCNAASPSATASATAPASPVPTTPASPAESTAPAQGTEGGTTPPPVYADIPGVIVGTPGNPPPSGIADIPGVPGALTPDQTSAAPLVNTAPPAPVTGPGNADIPGLTPPS